MTALPEMTLEQMEQVWLINQWHEACQEGRFRVADGIYDMLRELWK